MFANGARTECFFNSPFKYFDLNPVVIDAVTFSFADGSYGIASTMLAMQQVLFNIFQAAIELYLANPTMDDAFSNRAMVMEASILSGHEISSIQGKLHNV